MKTSNAAANLKQRYCVLFCMLAIAVLPIVATIMIVTAASIVMFITMIFSRIVASIASIIAVFAMLFLVTRSIFTVIPIILHKIDPLVTGIVFATVLVPMFGMSWRYT